MPPRISRGIVEPRAVMWNQRSKAFGMNKKYSLILALCQGADILILDEPTAGIDPFDRGAVVELIQEFMQNENHTMLFSTHITEDLDRIADYIAMIEDGKLKFMEEKEALLNSYRLVLFADVLEHLSHPREVLLECKKI